MRLHSSPTLIAALLSLPFLSVRSETVGGGTILNPAEGPAPSHDIGGKGFVLVKNWNFGSGDNNTIRSMAEMSQHFQYRDHYDSIVGGGGNYGAKIVAADAASALESQPVEGRNGVPRVRQFERDSLKTFVVPLNSTATEISVSKKDAGSGSFQAKWALPGAGKHLGHDILWETRVRYVPPKYFWYSHWIDGEAWHKVEIDVVESFGYDNGNDATNYDGRFWHSAIGLGKTPTDNFRAVKYGSWGNGMRSVGVPMPYDAGKYHIWSMLYRADNTVEIYVDGLKVQYGSLNWTVGGAANAEPMKKVFFLFDATWGNKAIPSVNKTMSVGELKGKFFEFDYSRVYLRPASGNPL